MRPFRSCSSTSSAVIRKPEMTKKTCTPRKPPSSTRRPAKAPPPRSGNRVEILVDGETALPRIADELVGARSQVHLAGWFFSPDFRLRPEGPGLRDLLADLAGRVDVRVLSWAGSPLPLFHPDRAQGRELRDALTRGTRVQCALDSRERPMHCHHEKLVIVDDRVAF